ncbi:MAG: serine/threonine protein kinase [Gemmatimonadetes bacterium]|nr:serine/threonine protein kinase [Gemmatimonadota bacterium]
MTPSPLLERLQEALSPDYRVERELASGGMGIVFLARDLTLDRLVAVKIIRPELATAQATESFLREARILASLRHPHIVTVYRAGEAAGLFYYIMELVEGETLHDRLRRGPLAPPDALKLGRDLLDGLEAVHQAGVVHRDIKPANVFLLGHRTLLADFGIARPPSVDSAGQGTPAYMSPEQMTGGPVTPQSDIFAVGLLLYEAHTGVRPPALGEKTDWSRVPRSVARVLRRALAPLPEDRWPDARSFRRALWRTRARRYAGRAALLTLGGLVAGAAASFTVARVRPPAASAGAVAVAVPSIAFVGDPRNRWIGDSLESRLRAELSGHPDFRVAESRALFQMTPSVNAAVRVEIRDGAIRARLSHPAGRIDAAEIAVPFDAWTALADSLAYRILLAVWDARSPLAPSLPTRALPRSAPGLARFLEAEQLVGAAKWGEAYRAYLLAEATDSTCWLCSWRVNDIERWLSQQHDPARVRRFLAHIDSFPPWYQGLIRATQLPLAPRLDTLRGVTERSPRFLLAWFQEGDELFHRGPLVGRRRAEAIAPFETAVRLRRDFGPAWEHLAWVFTAEGDSAGAVAALAALDRRGVVRDPFTRVLRSLLDLGFAWRFLSAEQAALRNERLFTDSASRDYPDFGAGPRLLPAFDAPRGAIALGRAISSSAASQDLRRSGLIAEVLGLVATGQLQRARETARRLADLSPEAEIALFTAELEGAIALLDPGAVSVEAATDALGRFAAPGAAEPLRWRAIWMSTLLIHRSPVRSTPGRDYSVLRENQEALPLLLFLQADSLAASGQLREALARTDAIEVDSTARHVDPFYRTVARLERAQWRGRLGDIEGASRELRWYQHTDLMGLPTGLPQAAEVDWAFGTLARWRLGRLLDGASQRGESCAAYQGVARHWAVGAPPYAARADSARERTIRLGCGISSQ